MSAAAAADSAEAIIKAPAPWVCKGQVYSFFFYTRPGDLPKVAGDVSALAYAPLERESFFASAEAGRFCGGLGGFMIVRYTDTPAGTYDELIIIPGAYSYQVEEKGKLVEKKNPRITRIYVSQKHTQFNGRKNWNIPKHIARFEWKDLPSGAKQLQVFPCDEDTTINAADATSPSPKPLFQASFKTIPYIPSFPMSTQWAKYLGMDTAFVQPPVPHGKPEEIACIGTEKWCRCRVEQQSSRTHVGWFDMSQRDEQNQTNALFENFWPQMGRWQLGIRMDDATLDILEPEFWDKVEASL